MLNPGFNLENYKNKLIHTRDDINFQPSDTVVVLQHELAITHANSKTPILATTGVEHCFIVALFDKKKKIAALAHMDALCDIQSLQDALKHMSNQVEAHVYGGRDDVTLAAQILQFLNENHISIINVDILRKPELPAAALAINAKDGTVYTKFSIEQLNYDEQTQQRMRDFDAANEARLKDGEKRAKEFITNNMHLWNDQTVMTAIIAALQQSSMNTIFVDIPKKQFGNSIWKKMTGPFHPSKNDNNIATPPAQNTPKATKS